MTNKTKITTTMNKMKTNIQIIPLTTQTTTMKKTKKKKSNNKKTMKIPNLRKERTETLHKKWRKNMELETANTPYDQDDPAITDTYTLH
jgi:hypothetical protein